MFGNNGIVTSRTGILIIMSMVEKGVRLRAMREAVLCEHEDGKEGRSGVSSEIPLLFWAY